MALGSINLKLRLDETQAERAHNFLDRYALETMAGNPAQKMYLGQKESPQKCRFCQKSEPDVTFKNDAHVIPSFMGNRYLLSRFECDTCNALFSGYETSFADFFGLSRTFAQIRGKSNKVPKYKDKKTGLEVEMKDPGIRMTTIEGIDPIKFDLEKKTLQITTERPGHIPIHIPKTILKVALSLLEEKDVADYDNVRRFLLQQDKDALFKDSRAIRIVGYFVPGPTPFQTPYAQLFRRKEGFEEELIPYRQIIIYYANYVLQMILPFGKPDRPLEGKQISVPVFPLLIDQSQFDKYGSYQQFNLNLTSNVKVSGQPHKLTFGFESYKDTLNNPPQTPPTSEPQSPSPSEPS